ncbi:(deoxy)nucleoside triphosphate pyrophosphohydrolase [Georgenia sp. MJ170]|uniref:(deoxy)nucleoside triphosphate pyrophosphohydrolase n=1 Tax=Georgenia sunbinii TaxID=3117728 RepID=UPI002F269573
MPGTRLVVAAAILDDLTTPSWLLAARRSAPAALVARWELPGGKVEAGELPEAAVHREIDEELGVGLVLGDVLPGPRAGDWPIDDRLTMRVWSAVLAAGEPAPLADHDELRWLPRGRWGELAWLPADVPIVAALEAHYGTTGGSGGRVT